MVKAKDRSDLIRPNPTIQQSPFYVGVLVTGPKAHPTFWEAPGCKRCSAVPTGQDREFQHRLGAPRLMAAGRRSNSQSEDACATYIDHCLCQNHIEVSTENF